MKHLRAFGYAILAFAGLTAPALAHPGDHSQMTLSQIAYHLAEPDHLFFIAIIVLVGIVAFRAGRRRGRRERSAAP
jgi:hydrogenase/urease accessory protein HupE